MAHKKGVGSSRNGRDSNPQYRGVKKFGGEKVVAGNIIVRQCGTKWHPGRNVGLGTDFTIYSLIDGVVKFEHKSKTRFKISVSTRGSDLGAVTARAEDRMALWDKLSTELRSAGKAARGAIDEGKLRLELFRVRQLADKAAQALGYAVHQAHQSGKEPARTRCSVSRRRSPSTRPRRSGWRLSSRPIPLRRAAPDGR